jgi:hypothetical protein
MIRHNITGQLNLHTAFLDSSININTDDAGLDRDICRQHTHMQVHTTYLITQMNTDWLHLCN